MAEETWTQGAVAFDRDCVLMAPDRLRCLQPGSVPPLTRETELESAVEVLAAFEHPADPWPIACVTDTAKRVHCILRQPPVSEAEAATAPVPEWELIHEAAESVAFPHHLRSEFGTLCYITNNQLYCSYFSGGDPFLPVPAFPKIQSAVVWFFAVCAVTLDGNIECRRCSWEICEHPALYQWLD